MWNWGSIPYSSLPIQTITLGIFVYVDTAVLVQEQNAAPVEINLSNTDATCAGLKMIYKLVDIQTNDEAFQMGGVWIDRDEMFEFVDYDGIIICRCGHFCASKKVKCCKCKSSVGICRVCERR